MSAHPIAVMKFVNTPPEEAVKVLAHGPTDEDTVTISLATGIIINLDRATARALANRTLEALDS